MFKILDGREHFYQWDKDRKLIIPENIEITEVHFFNRLLIQPLTCEPYEDLGIKVVDIPNILLQTDWKLTIYAYDENYTKYEQTYEVKKRPKPTDYIYTETENKNWETLEKKANDAITKSQEALDITMKVGKVADNANEAAEQANKAIAAMPYIFANALKGNKSGEIVAITDISPVEHDVVIKAVSKNLFKTTNYSLGSINGNDGELTNSIKNYAMTTDFIYLPSGKYILSNLVGANLRYIVFYNLNKEFESSTWTARAKTFKFTVKEDCYIRIDIERDSNIDIENFDTFMHEYQFMLEEGTTATAYTPYVDVSTATVNTLGKNLFNISADTRFTKQSDGSYINTEQIGTKKIPLALPYGTYTFSYDLSCPTGANGRWSIGLKDGTRVEVYKVSNGSFIHTETTFTGEVIDWCVVYSVIPGVETTIIKNIQLEAGSTATDYEPYIEPTSYPIAADGTVEGVTSIYPNMTITTDTTGGIVDAEYNRDINKAFAELQNALISLGGNV